MSRPNSLTNRLLGPLQDLIRRAITEHEERHPHGEPEDALTTMLVHGDRSRLHIAPTATVNNALFNLSAGHVTVREHAFFGHNVSVLTGTHDVTKFGAERKEAHPIEGRDVVIGEGVWVASNATIIGPCTIGEHAVVGACSLVQGDVEPYTVVAGVPAKEVRRIDHDGEAQEGERQEGEGQDEETDGG
jgi:acetyltransferase-like isoleucine patch superfamily enzyme